MKNKTDATKNNQEKLKIKKHTTKQSVMKEQLINKKVKNEQQP